MSADCFLKEWELTSCACLRRCLLLGEGACRRLGSRKIREEGLPRGILASVELGFVFFPKAEFL